MSSGVFESRPCRQGLSSREYFQILLGGASASCSEFCGVWWDCQRWGQDGQAKPKTSTNHLAIDRWLCRLDRECTRSHRWKIAGDATSDSWRRDLSRSPFHGRSLAWRTIRRFPWSQPVAVAIPMRPIMQLSSRRYQRDHIQKCSEMFRICSETAVWHTHKMWIHVMISHFVGAENLSTPMRSPMTRNQIRIVVKPSNLFDTELTCSLHPMHWHLQLATSGKVNFNSACKGNRQWVGSKQASCKLIWECFLIKLAWNFSGQLSFSISF